MLLNFTSIKDKSLTIKCLFLLINLYQNFVSVGNSLSLKISENGEYTLLSFGLKKKLNSRNFWIYDCSCT